MRSCGVLTHILRVKVALLDTGNEGRLQFACGDLGPIDIFTPWVLLDFVCLAFRYSLMFVFVEHQRQQIRQIFADKICRELELSLKGILEHLRLVSRVEWR